jgi:NADH-quinone oxidoreductase subunit C
VKIFDSIPTECVARLDYDTTGCVAEAWVKPANIRKAAQKLYEDKWMIEDLSVLDTAEGLLVCYHFDRMHRPGRIVVRVMAKDGAVPSIADIFQGANWHEREARDFHAVDFSGHPNLWPLLLPADMEPGVLLKAGEKKPLRELLGSREVLSCSPAVQALFAEPEAAEAAKE